MNDKFDQYIRNGNNKSWGLNVHGVQGLGSISLINNDLGSKSL